MQNTGLKTSIHVCVWQHRYYCRRIGHAHIEDYIERIPAQQPKFRESEASRIFPDHKGATVPSRKEHSQQQGTVKPFVQARFFRHCGRWGNGLAGLIQSGPVCCTGDNAYALSMMGANLLRHTQLVLEFAAVRSHHDCGPRHRKKSHVALSESQSKKRRKR